MQEKSKKWRTLFPIIGISIIACMACLFLQDALAQVETTGREAALPDPAVRAPLKKSNVHLYFADRDNYFLTSEQRVLTHRENPIDYARVVVEALIRGPQQGLVRTMASTTKLRAVYITSGGTCYVDLSRNAGRDHPGGCNSEILTIYSVVNSLVLNVPEIKRVKMLIEGEEALTLAGHIDLRTPLEANMLIIR